MTDNGDWISSLPDEDLFDISFEASTKNNSCLIYKKQRQNNNGNTSSSSKFCFNCLSPSHSLSACEVPLNKKMVAANKLSFSSARKMVMKTTRYHERSREVQIGVLSPKLRNALGLQDGDVPDFIIKMNTFGYPLGLLKKATKSVYIENSEDLINNHISDEEGEIREREIIFDTTRFHTFPGFNAPVITKTSSSSVPGYNPKNNLRRMIEAFEDINKKKLNVREENSEVSNEAFKTTKYSSDVVDSIDGITNPDEHNTCSTPTRTDLECSIHVGTPVLSHQIKQKLPDISKFSKDMGELVNFENHRDYTGNYEVLKQTVEKFKKSGLFCK